jgi:hypothetical protein
MRLSRRSFLRAAVVSPLIVGAWEAWERGVRPGGRVRPVVCCLPNGVRGRSCAHPAPLKAGEQPKGSA